jgi:hypothetical protein
MTARATIVLVAASAVCACLVVAVIDCTSYEAKDPESVDAASDAAAATDADAAVADAALVPPCEANTFLDETAPWPLVGGCASNVGRSAYAGPRVAPARRWQQALPGTDYGPPALTHDAIVFGVEDGQHGVVAFALDGRSLWSAPVKNSCCGGISVARGGIILAGTGNAVTALSAAGGVAGAAFFPHEVDVAPTISPSGSVLIGTITNPGQTNEIASLDLALTTKWLLPQDASSVSGELAVAADGRVIVGVDDGTLRALLPDGGMSWSTLLPNPPATGPVVENGAIYVITTSGELRAFDLEGGPKWAFSTGLRDGGASAARLGLAIARDGTVYVPGTSTLVALNPDGSTKWTYPTVATVSGHVIVDAEGTIFVVTLDSFLHAIAPDGTARWAPVRIAGLGAGLAIGANRLIYVVSRGPSAVEAFGEP